MGASLAGLLIITVLFTTALIIFRTNLFTNAQIGDSIKEISDVTGERARTVIKISTTTGDQSGGCDTARIQVENTGATSISNFSDMDVIVQFTSGDNQVQKLNYVTGNTPSTTGDWARSLSPQDFAAGIFNPGEIMVITAILSITQTVSTGEGAVTVGTPNGVTATRTFPDNFQVTLCPVS